MKYENRNYVYQMSEASISRKDKAEADGKAVMLPNIAGLDNMTQLKNLKAVFDMSANDKLFKAYLQAIDNGKGDRMALRTQLDRLATQKQFESYTRTCADGSKQLQYGLYIYAGIPHSTLSVDNCKAERLNHTGTSLASYSDKSDFITLDKTYYAKLQQAEQEPIEPKASATKAKAKGKAIKSSKNDLMVVSDEAVELTKEQLAEIASKA